MVSEGFLINFLKQMLQKMSFYQKRKEHKSDSFTGIARKIDLQFRVEYL
jgi:hypothetical protein